VKNYAEMSAEVSGHIPENSPPILPGHWPSGHCPRGQWPSIQ